MQNKKQLKTGQDKDPVLVFLGIFFISGMVALIGLLLYYMVVTA